MSTLEIIVIYLYQAESKNEKVFKYRFFLRIIELYRIMYPKNFLPESVIDYLRRILSLLDQKKSMGTLRNIKIIIYKNLIKLDARFELKYLESLIKKVPQKKHRLDILEMVDSLFDSNHYQDVLFGLIQNFELFMTFLGIIIKEKSNSSFYYF